MVCQFCPESYHKQCLSKRLKIVKDGVILCSQHRKLLRTIKYTKEEVDEEKTKIKEKEKKVPKPAPVEEDKKSKKLTSKEKRKNLLPYEHFKVTPPDQFDYEATKEPYCVYCGA